MSVADTDLVEVLRGGVSYKATGTQINDYLAPSGYEVPYSAYFNGNASKAYLWKDTVTGDTKKLTISFWLKLESNPTYANGYKPGVIQIGESLNHRKSPGYTSSVEIDYDEKIAVRMGPTTGKPDDTGFYAKASASKPVKNTWEHWCFTIDTYIAGADKCKFYKNGTKQSLTGLRDMGVNIDGGGGIQDNTGATGLATAFNRAYTGTLEYPNSNSAAGPSRIDIKRGYRIGQYAYDNSMGSGLSPKGYVDYFKGYLADFYLVDGQALPPTDFGEDSGGEWKAKAYEGSYGPNGFHLTFEDEGNLGKDYSGKNNNFTKVGTISKSTDTPTST